MNNTRLLLAAALGAGLVYMFDPQGGGRRRALMRDKLVRAGRLTRDAMDATTRDIANRSRGIVAATQARWRDEEVSDSVLLERVRAKLGRWTSHPRAIDIEVNDGQVALRGPILADEAPALLAAVPTIRGVMSVVNELDLHETPDGVPSLQGEGSLAGPSLDILQRNWAPATQALVAGAGLLATGLCLALYTRRSEAA